MSIAYSIDRLPDWLAAYICENPSTGCWNWTGPVCHEGYGRSSIGRGCHRRDTRNRLHRIVWKLANGEIPNGLFVLHTCDNRRCCNPAHLFLGTCSDNIKDMWKKGRGILPISTAKGEQNGHAKVTAENVIAIKIRRERGELVSALAQEYGVCQSTICKLAKGRRWKHVAW